MSSNEGKSPLKNDVLVYIAGYVQKKIFVKVKCEPCKDYLRNRSNVTCPIIQLKNNNKDQVVEILLESDRDLRRDYHVQDFEDGGSAKIDLRTIVSSGQDMIEMHLYAERKEVDEPIFLCK